MAGPTWYEILGVGRDASPDEIKAAWRSATDKFEPGSGQSQFRLFNEAADVLLDPRRRQEYDAQLVGSPAPDETTPAPTPPVQDDEQRADEPAAAAVPRDEPDEDQAERPDEQLDEQLDEQPDEEPAGAAVSPAGRSRLQAVLLGLVALALLVSAVFVVVLAQRAEDAGIGFLTGVTQGEAPARHRAGTNAGAAAERALAAALSYDYRRLEADKDRALAFMTPRYAKEFGDTFDKLLTAAEKGQPNNVVKTKTVVKAAVQQVGVMNPSAATTDRVRILAYVNQSATKGEATPTIFQNRVAVTMVKRDGEWLIDRLVSY